MAVTANYGSSTYQVTRICVLCVRVLPAPIPIPQQPAALDATAAVVVAETAAAAAAAADSAQRQPPFRCCRRGHRRC